MKVPSKKKKVKLNKLVPGKLKQDLSRKMKKPKTPIMSKPK